MTDGTYEHTAHIAHKWEEQNKKTPKKPNVQMNKNVINSNCKRNHNNDHYAN